MSRDMDHTEAFYVSLTTFVVCISHLVLTGTDLLGVG